MANPAATVSNAPAQPQGLGYQMGSLYVGDLHPDVTEAILFDKFQTAGPIISIRVCRDIVTRRSLGYAYVNFQQPADAERALDSLNYELIRGKPVRIMWSQRDPSMRRSGLGNVFIKNLDKSIDNRALYDTFSTFGSILSCKIMTDESGESRGYGFVHFENQDAAKTAISTVNGMLLSGKKVYAGPFIPRAQRMAALGPRKVNNIFIKNFAESLDDQKLRELFEPFGKITSCVLMRNEDGTSKGFGFCCFENPDDAEKAIAGLAELEIEGRKITVLAFKPKKVREDEKKRALQERRQERSVRYQGVNLYVKNLDDTIDDAKLRETFSSYGTITSAKVMVQNGRSRGFGFVCFSAPDEATKAVTEMNGAIVGSKPLYVALAQIKEQRRAILNQQFAQRSVPRYPQQILPYGAGLVSNMPYMANPMGMAATRQMYAGPIGTNIRAQPRWGTGAGVNPQTYRYPTMNTTMNGINYVTGAAGQPQQRSYLNPGVGVRANMPPGARSVMNGTTNATMNPSVRMPTVPRQPMTAAYTTTARNLPNQQTVAYPVGVMPSTPEPLTAAALANANPQQQKQMLGERLYPLILQLKPEHLVGKITGMLLEIDNTEILHLIESTEALRLKVDEAEAVLLAHQQKQVAAANQAVNNAAPGNIPMNNGTS